MKKPHITGISREFKCLNHGVWDIASEPAVEPTRYRREFVSPNQIRNLLMAVCLLFIAPMLVLFVFLQKYFIRSIERVGIVG